jgi:hypothetical protein
MNDDQLMTAVRESFAEVRLDVPLEQTVRRGRVLRGRGRAYRAAVVAGIAAIAGVTAVAVTGPGQGAPPAASAHAAGAAGATGATGAPVVTGPGGVRLDAWTVTKGKGGTVSITIRQLLDVAGLQRALRADGVPARVAFQPGLPSSDPPMPPGCTDVHMSGAANDELQGKIFGGPHANMSAFAHGILVTIAVRQIPAGVGIYLAVQSGSNEHTHFGWSTNLVQRSRACTG